MGTRRTYRPRDEPTLQPEVRQYEPHTALFGGNDGLGAIRTLLGTADDRLAPGGWLIVEFGFGQEAGVRDTARRTGWTVTRMRSDLQAIPRVAVLRR